MFSLNPQRAQQRVGTFRVDAYSPRLPPAAVWALLSSSDPPDTDSLAGTAPRRTPERPRASPKAAWSLTHHPHSPPVSQARQAAISGLDQGRQAPPSIGV